MALRCISPRSRISSSTIHTHRGKAGDIVKVKVLEVDLQRKRIIALTMRLDEQPGETAARRGGGADIARRATARRQKRRTAPVVTPSQRPTAP